MKNKIIAIVIGVVIILSLLIYFILKPTNNVSNVYTLNEDIGYQDNYVLVGVASSKLEQEKILTNYMLKTYESHDDFDENSYAYVVGTSSDCDNNTEVLTQKIFGKYKIIIKQIIDKSSHMEGENFVINNTCNNAPKMYEIKLKKGVLESDLTIVEK